MSKKSEKLPNIAVIGRANVGKSTLFNRLSSSSKSITLDYPGVTRDILHDEIEWKNQRFNIIDTGGISFKKEEDSLLKQIYNQAFKALEKSDVIVFLVDGSTGVTSEDLEISDKLHKLGKKVILTINKSDKLKSEEFKGEFYELGHEQIVSISAEHGIGINHLLDMTVESIPQKHLATQKKPAKTERYKILIFGRPNVGKSSLMNALLKKERVIVSDVPGTTREAIKEKLFFDQQQLTLIDTPGIRKKKTIKSKVETLMVKSALASLKDTDIAILLIDITEGKLVDQELKLAFYTFEKQYKALIILINKYDLATAEQIATLEHSFEEYKHLIKNVPVLKISCKTEKNIGRIMPLISSVWQAHNTTFPEGETSLIFKDILNKRPLMHAGKPLKMFKIDQIRSAPITILLKVNQPDWFGQSQLKFFENTLRANYNLKGAPIKFIVRAKNPKRQNT